MYLKSPTLSVLPTASPARRSRLRSRAFRLTVAVIMATVALALWNSTAHAAPDKSQAGGKISRSEVLERARNWYDNRDSLNYDNSRAPDTLVDDMDGQHRYGPDCSGFVSMAWHLPPGDKGGRTTRDLAEVATPISRDELAPGDALNDPADHVILFDSWEPDHQHFSYYSFGGKHPALVNHASFDDPELSGHPTDRYQALRYRNIVEDTTSSTDRLDAGDGEQPADKPPTSDTPTASSDRLGPNEELNPGDERVSANGRFHLKLETNGQLVLYDRDQRRWAGPEPGKPVDHAIMQSDGNLVLYNAPDDDPANAVWATNTDNDTPAFLVVQDDGNVVIYEDRDRDGHGERARWATDTWTEAASGNAGESALDSPSPQPEDANSGAASDQIHDGNEGMLDEKLASLGDSFSSGEADAPYDEGTDTDGDRCHRSPNAWPRLLGVAAEHHLACSGATTENLRKGQERDAPDNTGQIDRLAHLAKTVKFDRILVTMGGNDIDFADRVRDCYVSGVAQNAVPWRRDDPGSVGCLNNIDDIKRDLSNLRPKLVEEYKAIAAAGGAPLLVVGYPNILPAKNVKPVNCSWLRPRDQQRAAEVVEALDESLHDAASDAGAEYLSIADALQGHELCTHDSWVYRLKFPPDKWDKQQAHPLPSGQQAIAGRVRDWLVAHR